MPHILQDLAALVNGELIGDGKAVIRGVNSVDTVQEGEIAFAENPQRLQQALQSEASALIVTEAITHLNGKSGIRVRNPKLAFAQLLTLFFPYEKAAGVTHPTAVIGNGVQLAQPVDIRAHAFIGDRTRIGKGTIIEPSTYIGPDVRIGEDCWIGPNVSIYHHIVIGNRVRLHGGVVLGGDGFGYVFHEGRYVKIPQVGIVVIEDDVEIGCNSCVDRATVGSTMVRQGTKIDNQVQVAHNDQIGRHVILSGQVGLAGSITISDYCLLGGKSGVVDHVLVGKGARLGAATIVTKDVPPGVTVFGYPARETKQAREQIAAIGRLPALRKRVAELEARLAELEQQLSSLTKKNG